jgi:hypothetical protein
MAFYNIRSCPANQACRRKDVRNLLPRQNDIESQTIVNILKGGNCWETPSGSCWQTASGSSWQLP